MRHVGYSILAWSLAFACGGTGGDTRDTTAVPPAPGNRTAKAPPRGAATAGAIADPFVQLARVEGSTFIEILEVKARADGTLFYCTAVRGLQIVDVKDPTRPKTLAQLKGALTHERFARCQHLDWDGDTLYFTNHGDRIQPTPFVSAYDLSKSPHTQLATFTKKGHTFEGIAAAKGKAYVAMHGGGLMVLELSGGKLVERGIARGLRGAWGVAVSGNYVYVAETKGSLAIVDVSDPARPTFVSRIATGGSGQSVTIAGNLAYVAAGAAGMAIVDVSNPRKPSMVAQLDTDSSTLQIAVAGNHAYLANWNDVRVYDVSTPRSPKLVATENVSSTSPFSRVLGISAVGNIAYIGEWTGMYTYALHPARRAPDIALDEIALDFGRVATGASKKLTLTVDNEGTSPLVVSSIKASSAAFAVTPRTLTIAPGGSATVSVSFLPASGDATKESLSITSNDPDETERVIPLEANRPGLALGDPSPEIEVSLVEGGDWKLSAQRGKVVVLAYFATF